jgi:uncharacterized protein
MPANLSPEYRKAEQAFRSARDPHERLECLKEMLRTIPKHKGTEHIQADIRSRVKQLTDDLGAPRKGPARSTASHAVHHEGAAQICLVGPPNSGKSSLHALLTGSRAESGPFSWTTKDALPGMLSYEDIAFQLVDLPPVTAERIEAWMPGVLQSADAVWLVVDIADADCTEQVLATCSALAQRKVTLSERWPGLGAHHDAAPASPDPDEAPERHDRMSDVEDIDDPFRVHIPALLVANKCDLDPDPDEVGVLEELADVHFPAIATSATSGHGLDRLGPFVFEALGIVRVYTKLPGHAADKRRPFTVRRGGTVLDVARLVHQDVARTLKYARLWGSSAFDGQQVGADHRVSDGDIVELHAK